MACPPPAAAAASLCFYRVEDWWTYELCYKLHVRQFHKENNVIVNQYSLGTYDEDKSKPDEVQVRNCYTPWLAAPLRLNA